MTKIALKNGIVTTLLMSFITIACQIGSVAYLARRLSPNDFGVVAILVSLFTIASIFSELSFGSNIIQRKESSNNFISAVMYFVVSFSSIIIIGFLIIFPYVNKIFDIDSFKIFSLLSFLVLLIPLSSIFDSLVLRELKFYRSLLGNILSTFIGVLVVPIMLEKMGFGIMALVAGAVLTPVIKILCLMDIAGKYFFYRPNFSELKTGYKFSLYFTMAKVLSMISLQGDRVILGAQLGNYSVGIYSRAQYLPQALINLLTTGLERVVFPILSKTKKEGTEHGFFNETLVFVAVITLIASIALIYCSSALIELMLGASWKDAIPIAQVLSLMVFIRSVDKISAIFMRRDEYVKERFLFQLYLSVATVLAVFFFNRFGLVFLSWIVVGINLIGLIYTQIRLSYILKCTPLEHFKKFKGAIIAATLYIFQLWLISMFIQPESPVVYFLVAIGAALPLIMVIVISPKTFFEEEISSVIRKFIFR